MDAELGLLILRIYLGLNFVAYGMQKVFGAFDGPGLSAYSAYVASLRLRPAKPLAAFGAVTELVAGLLLLSGLFIPVAAAAIIADMVVAIGTVHIQNGWFNAKGGMTYNVSLIASALCLAFAGGGALSLDKAFGTAISGVAPGLGALVGGVVAGLFVLMIRAPRSEDVTAG